MFKFQTIISGPGIWTANLFIEEHEELHIGTIGLDNEGLFIKTDRQFTLSELNLLIAQIAHNKPDFMNKKVEFLKLI